MSEFPSPQTGILLGAQESSPVNRAVARTIDLVLLLTLFLLGKVVAVFVGLALALAYALLQDSFWSGQSVGKRILGLQVIDAQSHEPCTAQLSLVRNLPFALLVFAVATPWLLFLLIAVMPLSVIEAVLIFQLESGNRLGDVIAGTRVRNYVGPQLTQE